MVFDMRLGQGSLSNDPRFHPLGTDKIGKSGGSEYFKESDDVEDWNPFYNVSGGDQQAFSKIKIAGSTSIGNVVDQSVTYGASKYELSLAAETEKGHQLWGTFNTVATQPVEDSMNMKGSSVETATSKDSYSLYAGWKMPIDWGGVNVYAGYLSYSTDVKFEKTAPDGSKSTSDDPSWELRGMALGFNAPVSSYLRSVSDWCNTKLPKQLLWTTGLEYTHMAGPGDDPRLSDMSFDKWSYSNFVSWTNENPWYGLKAASLLLDVGQTSAKGTSIGYAGSVDESSKYLALKADVEGRAFNEQMHLNVYGEYRTSLSSFSYLDFDEGKKSDYTIGLDLGWTIKDQGSYFNNLSVSTIVNYNNATYDGGQGVGTWNAGFRLSYTF